MPNVAPIVINDGQTTPVAHTFTPTGRPGDGNQRWSYTDDVGGISLGMPEITHMISRPASGSRTSDSSRVTRVKASVRVPVLETLGNSAAGYPPAPTLAYYLLANVEFIMPERSTEANRKDLLAFVANLMDHSVMTELAVKLRDVY